MWRSLVAHLTGGQGVAGSNPVIPTNKYGPDLRFWSGPFSLSVQLLIGSDLEVSESDADRVMAWAAMLDGWSDLDDAHKPLIRVHGATR